MATTAELRQLRLFARVSPSEIERLLGRFTVRRFDAGEMIYSPADTAAHMYLLLDGRVKTYVSLPDGRQQIMHVFHRDDAFGELLSGAGAEPWATAVDATTCVVLDDRTFQQLMTDHPQVCLNVFGQLVEHHRSDVQRLHTLIHTDAQHRLVLTLLQLGDLQGDAGADEFALRGYSHTDLANMIGVVRTTVSELMSGLRGLGVVRTSGRRVVVDRRAADRYLAGG